MRITLITLKIIIEEKKAPTKQQKKESKNKKLTKTKTKTPPPKNAGVILSYFI